MRFKSYFTALFLALISFTISAKPVDKATAERVAIHFYYSQANLFDSSCSLNDLTIVDTYKTGEAYYVFNFEKGWVIVAADDVMWPVVGYNFTGHFPSTDQLNTNLKSWMKTIEDEATYVAEQHIQASPAVLSEWATYNKTDSDFTMPENRTRSEVEPMLSCNWDQPDPYNLLCPDDEAGPGGHALVGCVATAMAQIMDYWRYPIHGSGQFSYYESPYGVISADFGNATYEWDGMQNSIDPDNPWAIALISFHAGVAVQMNYGPTASGSQSTRVPHAFSYYFTYDGSAQYLEKKDYSFSTWQTMMQADLDAGQPLYYSGFSNDGGHAFVCDGYQGDNYYHFNWGWSGYQNGYYTLQDVNGFSSGQGMVRNIIPGDADYPYVADGEDTLTQPSGSFTDGSGPVEDYPSGMNASWLISPQNEEDSVTSITLSFVKFDTDPADTLRVYGGNSTSDDLLGKYAGSDLPENLTFDGNQMLVTFSSTGSAKGFLIEYNTTSPSWCNGSETYSEPSGTFTDGSGSFYYNNNTNCMYKITNPEAVNITLEFTEFSTEADNDVLQVFDGDSQTLLGEFSGDELPDVISEETSTLMLLWSTNSTVKGPGWTADYYIDGVGIGESSSNNFAVYPNPTTGYFNITFDELPSNNSVVQVISMNGQVVYRETISKFSGKNTMAINLKGQPKGIYLLSLISGNKKVDKKIVLK